MDMFAIMQQSMCCWSLSFQHFPGLASASHPTRLQTADITAELFVEVLGLLANLQLQEGEALALVII